MTQAEMPFEIGKEYKFFGVDSCRFKLDGKVYEAIEDESDGYRSCLGSIEVAEEQAGVFFSRRLDVVVAEEVTDNSDGRHYGGFDGWVLKSVKDGHEWLRFGTGNFNDYYPCFEFYYQPRTPSTSHREAPPDSEGGGGE